VAPDLLPLVPIRRVLVPGTRAALPCSAPGLGRDRAVVTVFTPVGTRAVVEALRPLAPRLALALLRGEGLVRLLGAGEDEGVWQARVAEVEEPGPGAEPLVAGVERALHRYLALRGEAGEAAGPLPRLSRDPLTASHEVASHLQISWPEVQEILEAGSAADRLRREKAVLDREAELLRRLLGREGA
jgi:hypothetical protein